MLPWSRAQQAAFLIAAGRRMREAVVETGLPWAEACGVAMRKKRCSKSGLLRAVDPAEPRLGLPHVGGHFIATPPPPPPF